MPRNSSPFTLRDQEALPANPPSGSLLLYSRSGKIYSKDSTGVEVALGGGGGAADPTAYTPTNPPPGIQKKNLVAWRSALANRVNSPAVIAGIGDSIMEGVGAADSRYSWMHRIGLFTETGSENPPYFVPIKAPLTANLWTDSGSNTDQPGFGIGRRSRNFPAAAYAETTFVGDRFTLHYAKDLGGGTVTVTVDGAQIGTFSVGNATFLDGQVWDSGQLARGFHTVRVTSGGTFRFSGAKFFDGDFAKGIHVYPGGVSGATTIGWRQPVNAGQDAADTMWPAAYAAVNPDLVIISLIANDYLAQTDPALTGANYTWMVSTLRRVCTFAPSFVFLIPPARTDVTPAAGRTYDDYVNAIVAAAGTDSEIEVVDLRQPMSTTVVSTDPSGYWYDNIHPSTLGHQRIFDVIVDRLGMESAVNVPPVVKGLTLPETPDSAVSAPASGSAFLYTPDGGLLRLRDDNGYVHTVGDNVPDVNLQSDYVDTTPPAPLFGVKLFSRFRARRMLAAVGPMGQDTALQPSLFSNRVARWSATPNSTVPTQDGIVVTHLNNATATPTAVAQATTGFFASLVRQRFATTATAGTGAGIRSAVQQFFLSSTANMGGFFFVARFGLSAVTATNRVFVGLNATTTALSPTVDPSTFTNMIGFASNAAHTNLRFMCNAAGTATQIDLGANFPTNSANTYFYEVRMFAPSGGGSVVYYSITRLNDGIVVQGSVNTNLPAIGQMLAPHMHHSNGTTAAVASIDIQSLYVETDN